MSLRECVSGIGLVTFFTDHSQGAVFCYFSWAIFE